MTNKSAVHDVNTGVHFENFLARLPIRTEPAPIIAPRRMVWGATRWMTNNTPNWILICSQLLTFPNKAVDRLRTTMTEAAAANRSLLPSWAFVGWSCGAPKSRLRLSARFGFLIGSLPVKEM